MILDVEGDHRLDGGNSPGVDVAEGGEVVGDRPGLVESPGSETAEQLVVGDQAVLEGEQAEDQVTVGVSGHRSGLPGRNDPGMVSRRDQRIEEAGKEARSTECKRGEVWWWLLLAGSPANVKLLETISIALRTRSQPMLSSQPSRRAFLQVGYSGLVGLSLPGLLAARSPVARPGRAKSVIVILLSGGLGQHESFDMKPEAPDGIRGEFKPIDTVVPGVRICEHLPMLAARMNKLAVVRTMAHPEGNHLLAVHRVLTGQESAPRGASDLDRVASRDDFPCYAAALDKVRRRDDGIPNGVSLPLRLVEGPLTWPGQDAGFLGPRHDPWQLRLDPNKPESKDDSLALAHRARLRPAPSAAAPDGPDGFDLERRRLRRPARRGDGACSATGGSARLSTSIAKTRRWWIATASTRSAGRS